MADPIAIGAVLGETYEIVRLLGRGGMGSVWEARHLRLAGKRVAIKVLLADRVSADGAQAYARFQREAQIASRLGHPNIIEALDFNTLPDGAPYIVLEYLQGETLGARLRRGPLDLDETFAIVRQIGSALAAAHEAGVVHRDLKPDNIFLCPTDSGGELGHRVKILDFGISKIRDSQSIVTTDQTVLGTPQYMAPEQASAKHGEVDARTDQFALGAIVYEMIAGQAAFAGPTLVSVVYKVMVEQPEPLPTLRPGTPPRVAAAVMRALAKAPGERFPSVEAFVEALTDRPLLTLGRAREAEDGGAAELRQRHAPTAEDLRDSPTTVEPPGRRAQAFALAAAGMATLLVGALAVRGRPLFGGGEPAPATPPLVSPAVHAAGTQAAPSAIPTPAPAPPATPPPKVEPAPPPAALAAPTAVGPSPGPSATAPAVPAPASPAAIDAGAPAATAPPASPAAAAGGKPGRSHARSDSPLPPALATVVGELDAAEAALGAGDVAEARRLANHSLLTLRTPRAYALLARAACREGDLGRARAQLPHVGPERARVIADCLRAGVNLR